MSLSSSSSSSKNTTIDSLMMAYTDLSAPSTTSKPTFKVSLKDVKVNKTVAPEFKPSQKARDWSNLQQNLEDVFVEPQQQPQSLPFQLQSQQQQQQQEHQQTAMEDEWGDFQDFSQSNSSLPSFTNPPNNVINQPISFSTIPNLPMQPIQPTTISVLSAAPVQPTNISSTPILSTNTSTKISVQPVKSTSLSAQPINDNNDDDFSDFISSIPVIQPSAIGSRLASFQEESPVHRFKPPPPPSSSTSVAPPPQPPVVLEPKKPSDSGDKYSAFRELMDDDFGDFIGPSDIKGPAKETPSSSSSNVDLLSGPCPEIPTPALKTGALKPSKEFLGDSPTKEAASSISSSNFKNEEINAKTKDRTATNIDDILSGSCEEISSCPPINFDIGPKALNGGSCEKGSRSSNVDLLSGLSQDEFKIPGPQLTIHSDFLISSPSEDLGSVDFTIGPPPKSSLEDKSSDVADLFTSPNEEIAAVPIIVDLKLSSLNSGILKPSQEFLEVSTTMTLDNMSSSKTSSSNDLSEREETRTTPITDLKLSNLDIKSSGESENNKSDGGEDSIINIWSKILSQIYELIANAADSLSNISDKQVLGEVLTDPKGSDYVRNIVEIYRVFRRIEASLNLSNNESVKDEKIKEKCEDIERAWKSFTVYIKASSHMPNRSALDFTEENGENKANCGICRLSTINTSVDLIYNDSKLVYENRPFHASCANLWINTVESVLP